MISKPRRKESKQMREFTRSQDVPFHRQLSGQEATPRLETSIHSLANKSNSNLSRVAANCVKGKPQTAYQQIRLELETDTSKYSIRSPMKPSVKKKEMLLRSNIYEEIRQTNRAGIDSVISTILISCDHKNQWCMHDQLFDQSSDGETLKQIIDFKKSWYKSIYKIEQEFLQTRIIKGSTDAQPEELEEEASGCMQEAALKDQSFGSQFKSYCSEKFHEPYLDEMRVRLGMVHGLRRKEYFNYGEKHNLVAQFEVVSTTRYRRGPQRQNENVFCGCNLTCQF